MSSPKMICKSAYTKNIEHIFNSLEYVGNAIASQAVIFKDGSVLEVSADKKIYFPEAEIPMIDKINIGFKDGGSKNISYETYRKIVEKTKKVVTVDDLVPVTGNFSPDELDFLNMTGEKPYRELMDMDIFKYVDYFAHRHGVVKSVDGHGLFGVTGDVSIEDAKELALEHIASRKWLHILSLPEGEDVRTGFDRREMWQALISAEAPRISKLYNISLENLVINAGLHRNTENAHCHLILYSKDPKEGYIKGGEKSLVKASERLKSIFLNNIFKGDISSLNISKALARDELKTSLDMNLKNINQSPSFSKEISDKFLELAEVIKNDPDLKENSSYRYMKSNDKVLVDDLLRTMIMSDPNMKSLYEKYINIEKEYIENYNSDTGKIEKRLEDFEQRFFAPQSKSDNKSYHNIIYRAVGEFNKLEIPLQFERTAERKISDFKPDDSDLSSLLNYEPPPEDIFSLGSDYITSSFERTAETKIYDFKLDDSDLSSLLNCEPPPEDIYPFSSDYITSSFERTAETKIYDFKLDDSDLSSAKTKQSQVDDVGLENVSSKRYDSKYKAMSEYLGDKVDCVNFKSFSKLYRKSINGIFNPTISHSVEQVKLANKLFKLNDELSDKSKVKFTDDKIAKVNEIFDLVNTIDPKFKDCIDILAENSFDVLEKQFGADETDKYINSFFNSLDNPAQLGACKSHIYYLAETVYDQKYYQLLQAYKELGKPLNKAIFNALSDINISSVSSNDRELISSLGELKEIENYKKYLNDSELTALYCDKIKVVLGHVCEKEEINEELKSFIGAFSKVFVNNFNAERAEHYTKRFASNLLSPKRLLRAHYSIISLADSADNIIASKIIEQFKKPLNDILNVKLTECLCDNENSFSSDFIMQRLKAIRDFEKPEGVSEILKYLYAADNVFINAFDNNIESCYSAFKTEFGTEKAREHIEYYKSSFFSADMKNPFQRSIKYFAASQFEREYDKILKTNKELFEPIKLVVKEHLNSALKPHNSHLKTNDLLNALDIKITELNMLSKIETPDEGVKQAIKENLKHQSKIRCEILGQMDNEKLNGAVDECTSKFYELFQKFCEPNDALAMSERLKSDIYSGEANISSNYTMQFYATNAPHIRQSNIDYRNALAVKTVGRLMKIIASSLNSHASYLHNENKRRNDLENTLRASKQFKTKNFNRGGFNSMEENQITR